MNFRCYEIWSIEKLIGLSKLLIHYKLSLMTRAEGSVLLSRIFMQ